MESEVLAFMMDHVMVCPVNSVAHVPHSFLARVLRIELRKACSSVWSFICLKPPHYQICRGLQSTASKLL